MDDDAPGLGVGFQIETGASFESLARLDQKIDSVTARAIDDFNKMERASAGALNLNGATVGISSFGAAATRELATAAREMARVERAGERMVGTIDRQAAAFGKTREEIRATKAETTALAAEQVGLTELAERLRAAEAQLYAQEQAAARQTLADAQAATAAREVAARAAAEEAEQIARLNREAADATRTFEAYARQKMALYREQQAAAAAAEREIEQLRQRQAAEAAMIAQLAERARLEAALERTTGVGRVRATDAGATYSALAAKAAEDEARATALAGAAAKQAAEEHARLAAMVRGSQAAQEADAAAAERLRASTDPLYAATKRLNAEIAESTRLYHAGSTVPAEYARQQAVLTQRLNETTAAHNANAGAARRSGFAVQQTMLQMPDIIQGLLTGQKPFQVFIQQGGQLAQVAQMAEGGVKGFAKEIGVAALGLVPFAAAAAVAGVAIYRWKEQLDDDAGLKKYAAGLGLTHKEMKKLGDQAVTTGDLMAGLWKTVTDGTDIGGSGKSIMDHLFSPDDAKQVQGFVASIYGVFAGGYDAIVALWGSMSATVSGYISAIAAAASRFFAPVVAAAQWAGNAVGSVFNTVYQWVAGWVKSVSGFLSPILTAIGQGPAATAISKAGSSLGSTFGDAYAKRVAGFIAGSNGFVSRVGANTVDAAQARLKKKADELIADRAGKKPKVDRHAEQLVRGAEAIEAQIRNLYKLADAYGVSGAAALIAEARVKAESQAIKQRGDIDAAVERQVRLEIAQRVSNAAKATASMRDQADAQALVNNLVAGGLIPAERAADLVKDQIADLPLLAAVQAATMIGNKQATEAATAALEAQRKERARLKAQEEAAAFNVDQTAGANQLETLRAELRLIGATDAARVHELATIKATQEARDKYQDPDRQRAYVAQQVAIADAGEVNRQALDAFNASLTATADLFDTIDQSAQRAASGMADAFGDVGSAIGSALTVMTGFYADQARLQEAHKAAVKAAGEDQARINHENQLYALRSSTLQIGAFGDMAAAARGFFKEGTTGYSVLAGAEKAFRLVQFAMSVRAIAQDAIETGSSLANSAARTAANAVEAVTKAISSLPFPANIAAGAATIAALAAIGVSIAGSFGGGKNTLPKANEGTGTVLGDSTAKSESIKNAIDALREVDLLTNSYSRQMAASLKSIDSQIGNVAALVVRAGDVDANDGVTQGFKTNAVGSVLKTLVPVFGGALASLFGTKTTVVGNGLYAGAQTLGSILDGGFDASYYSDVQKKKKLFGITTSTKYSTQYSAADAGLENQFTLILKQFNSAIAAAAGPLGASTSEIQQRLNGFVVNLGKIDLKDLTGEQIQEKLTAVFGAAADDMAKAAFPGFERFQKVGEGAFETLVRVSSTVEAVTTALGQLGAGARSLGIDAKIALADQFDSISDLTSAVDSYFTAYFSKEEQAAAKTAQLASVFGSLGLSMPATLAGFRGLVEAQDLTTAAGQATYATLLKLAPAFADLQTALNGAKSAADIASERQGLERQLLELRGDTAAIRALDLAKLDASNRVLQEQIWAIQDAQEAAKAADELRQAWTSVGDSIMDEVKRIRGLTDASGGNSFAALVGQFNAATAAARGGDQDAAKSLPGLSQALLNAAADAATSRQELDRVRAQTAASLEQTNSIIAALTSASATSTATSNAALLAAASTAQAASTPAAAANDDTAAEIRALKAEIVQMRTDNSAGQAAIASNTGRTAKILDNVTAPAGGEAIIVANAA